jgi:formylmethanofuran dehydrogenase subunit E
MAVQKMKDQNLDKRLQVAIDLHGHFGPFLALGVRIGLYALRELGVKEGDTGLHTTVMLEYVTPVSCILDGVQASTKCTVGNARLEWKHSKEIGAIFQLDHNKQRVEVWVKSAIFRELKRRLAAHPSDEETRQIGLDIASRSDAELFLRMR